MSATTHPQVDQFKAFLADPHGEEFKALRLHLLQCVPCRREVDTLALFTRHGEMVNREENRRAMKADEELEEMLAQQKIESFLDGRLAGDERDAVEKKIAKDRLALKAALHYASHSAAMQREMGADGKKAPLIAGESRGMPAKAPIGNIVPVIGAWFRRQRAIWFRFQIPATALATALLIFILTPLFEGDEKGLQITGYRDNPVMHFRTGDKTPGIGFFSNAPTQTRPFDNVRVSLRDASRVAITWPAVPGATQYTLRLTGFEGGRETILGEKSTTDTSLVFEGLEIETGRRYEWRLMGRTEEASSFTTEGGFVINRRGN